MIISQILGGLGNQMFQYALGRSIALRTGQELKLDISGLARSGGCVNITPRTFALATCNAVFVLAEDRECNDLKYRKAPACTKLWRKLRGKPPPYGLRCFRERGMRFNPSLFQITGDVYLMGFWQSYKYFADYGYVLREEFTPRHQLSAKTLEYCKLIDTTNAVSVHVRRGDYVTNPAASFFHGTCDLQYYRDAKRVVMEQVKEPEYFIFSDDLEWAKANLDFVHPATFVEYSRQVHEIEEIYLMSRCQHNIIANSSFSWWGAWLNSHPNRVVVAPKRWFRDPKIDARDMIPPDWLRL